MEALETLVVTRFPSVDVPVCVFTSEPKCVPSSTLCVTETPCVSGVVASVPGCVLPSTPCMSETPCVSETLRVSVPACVSGMVCVKETARMSERPSMRETACVRSLYVREMTVGMREHATACPSVNVMSWCVSVVTRRCAWVEWRRRQRDKGRAAAVAVLGAAPGLHGGEREGRAVQRTRPPRARLQE